MIESLVVNEFDISPSAMIVSQSHDSYMLIVSNLIASMRNSKSIELLNILLGHICRDDDHEFLEPLKEASSGLGSTLNLSGFMDVGNRIISIVFDGTWKVKTRFNIVNQSFVPFLSRAQSANLEAFFKSHVARIMAVIANNVIGDLAENYLLKAAAYHLMNLCYTLDKDIVHGASSEIAKAYCPNDSTGGKRLSMETIKYAKGIRALVLANGASPDITSSHFSLQNSAYASSAQVIFTTQSQVA